MRQKILNQVGILLISSVLVTFLVVSLAMYDKFSGYMQEDVREEIQYIKVAVEESQGDDLLEKMGEFTGSSRITLMQEDGTVILIPWRIPRCWKIIGIGRNLKKLWKRVRRSDPLFRNAGKANLLLCGDFERWASAPAGKIDGYGAYFSGV